MSIVLEKLPSVGVQPPYLQDLIQQIWPHRADEIYGLFLNGGGDIDAATDHPYVAKLDGTPVGISGFYRYDASAVGLCWHGIKPQHRGKGLSRAVFETICGLAVEKYPAAIDIIELIPSDRQNELVPYFEKLGFSHGGEVANFEYLPKGPEWRIYRAPLVGKQSR